MISLAITMNPASALQMHPKMSVPLDPAVASNLKLNDYYHWVYDHKPKRRKT